MIYGSRQRLSTAETRTDVTGTSGTAVLSSTTPRAFRDYAQGVRVSAHAGLPAAATILSKQSPLQVTLSGNLTANVVAGESIRFGAVGTSPTVDACSGSIRTKIVTSANSFAAVVPGDLVTGTGVPTGARVAKCWHDGLFQIELDREIESTQLSNVTLTFGDRVDITATGNVVVGTLRRLRGAFGVLLRFCGGNSANLLDAAALTLHDIGGSGAASSSPGTILETPAVDIAIATNFAYPNGGFAALIYQNALTSPTAARALGDTFPLDEADLALSVATGDVTGIAIDAWPIYEGSLNPHALPEALDMVLNA